MDIISLTARFLNVSLFELYESRTEKCTTARYMIWYYSHNENKRTILELSRKFHRPVRTIFHGINKIKTGLENQKYYRDLYQSFKEEVVAKCP